MIQIIKYFLLLYVLGLGLILPMANGEELKSLEKKKIQQPSYYKPLIKSKVAYTATTVVDNQVTTLYASKGKLVFQKGDDVKVLANKKITNTNLWLHKNKKNLYALWWTKSTKGKALYIRNSTDKGETFQEQVMLTRGGILPILSFADNGEDKIAIAYVNESEPGYQIYFNRSLDAGTTWLKQDMRLNHLYNSKGKVTEKDFPLKNKTDTPGSRAISPTLKYLDKHLVLQWQEQSLIEGISYLRLVTRISQDDGKTWQDEKEIYRIANKDPVEMMTVQVGSELRTFMFIPEKGLLMFSSSKQGTVWQQEGALAGTESFVFASAMKAAINEKNLLLTFTKREKEQKDNIELYSMSRANNKWTRKTEDIGLVAYPKEIPLNAKTKTVNSAITSFTDDVVVLAWEDHRYLMPTVILNYSINAGETWHKEVFPLLKPGKVISKFPSLLTSKDKLFVIFTHSDTEHDKFMKQVLYLASFDKTSEGKSPISLPQADRGKQLTDEGKMARLKKRSKEFWDLRIKEDYKDTFKYFDPLYRTLFDEANFVKSQGKIRFMKYSNSDIKLQGKVAFVETNVTFTIPVFATLGELMEAPPPQSRKMNARWGWFYDDWYLMPQTMFDRRFEF
ncbi:MAG: hypothetical protein KAG56_07960 [Sulfurovaceae bacterium]|nr:hypothetical protein [Sulfurovaceae bacterium]